MALSMVAWLQIKMKRFPSLSLSLSHARTHTKRFFIYRFTTCFCQDTPPPGNSCGNTQIVTDYI
jgi:hypothetical protein